MSKHKVVTHSWLGGVLTTEEYFFASLDLALKYAAKNRSHTVKVYADNGMLAHVANHLPMSYHNSLDSYA
jgi:hypothetical protein